ncbi:hypothetical protein LAG90_04900 [Marinilongibacter aquaticus]|uniref:DUF6090 family protein n=1 Tax=Marinilongibacter aquaticus TaxID=2975157 RepID=UPI0021BD259A|nr:DUF6090 family protein [Marinilongibacter aquaticus]UBM59987.1 hypothetical protein LAG90_04900 [Marinilongibacter aquaticus]
MKKTFIGLIKEIIPVIIGILIALFIDNWKEQKEEEKYVDQILESVKLELKENKTDIAENISSQKELIDSLNHYADDKELSVLQILYKVKGFHAPKIRTNYWIAISNTKIELFDYHKLSVLSNIEEEKELLKGKLYYLMNLIYSDSRDTSREKKEQVVLLVMDIISTERTINQEIEAFEDLQPLVKKQSEHSP